MRRPLFIMGKREVIAVKKILFTGSGVAIVTPFKDGKVNLSSFGRLIDRQIAGGTDAIIVCGTTG